MRQSVRPRISESIKSQTHQGRNSETHRGHSLVCNQVCHVLWIHVALGLSDNNLTAKRQRGHDLKNVSIKADRVAETVNIVTICKATKQPKATSVQTQRKYLQRTELDNRERKAKCGNAYNTYLVHAILGAMVSDPPHLDEGAERPLGDQWSRS